MRQLILKAASNRSVVYALIVGAVIFSLYKGYLATSEMRDYDLRWFYNAGTCHAQGLSPYDFTAFSACWDRDLGDPRIGPFVFLPSAILYVLPISYLDWRATQAFGAALGVVTLLALAFLLVRLSALARQHGPADLAVAFALAFGLSMTGIPGALHIGQPTVVVGLGAALLLLYIKDGSATALTLGLLLAAMKLHLALFLILLASGIATRRDRPVLAIAIVIALGCTVLLAGSPITFVGDYLDSLRVHATSEISQLHRPETLIGLVGLFSLDGISRIAAATSAILLGLGFFALGYSARHSDLSRTESAGILALLLSFLAFQLKQYDLAALAPLYAFATRLPLRSAALLALPLLILWRPRLLEMVMGGTLDSPQISTLMVVALFGFFLGHTLRPAGSKPH